MMKLFDRIVVFNTVVIAVVFGLYVIGVPEMSIRDIKTPTVNLPSLPKKMPEAPASSGSSLSEVSEPSEDIRKIDTPDIELPELNTPEVEIPDFEVPDLQPLDVHVPEFKGPELDRPTIRKPVVSFPKFHFPEFRFPQLKLPSIALPKFQPLHVGLPDFKLPKFSLPKFPEVAFGFDFDLENELNGKTTTYIAGVSDEIAKPTKKPLPSPTPSTTPTPTPIPVADPTHIDIPSIGVSAPIVNVGITPQNVMEIPTDFSSVGWYYPNGKPGEANASILNGHFDTPSGSPAVFYNLKNLKSGEKINITTADSKVFTFIVDDVYSHPLEAFPSDLIYGISPTTSIRIITCDGVWNPISQEYSKRLVVVAHLDK